MPVEQYPEHKKLKAVKAEAQICGDFVNWLEAQGWAICRYRATCDGEYVPLGFGLEKLLAQRFEIDLDKLEAEKRALLQELQRPTPAEAAGWVDPKADPGEASDA